jgi:GNAT superfamily N-acetyltransferase
MLEIVEACTPSELDGVRELFVEYKQAVGVDLWFGSAFQRELDDLPGAYAPPAGRLVLAKEGDAFVGCAALRLVASYTVELRRVWVRRPYRGRGIAHALVDALLDWARDTGHRHVRLEVLSVMPQADALFRSIGFAPIPDDRPSPFPGSVLLGRTL